MDSRVRFNQLDRWMIRIGFNPCDIAAMRRRNVYYVGIIVMFAVAGAFSGLTILSWLN